MLDKTQVSGRRARVQNAGGHNSFFSGEPHNRIPQLPFRAAVVRPEGDERHRHHGNRQRAARGMRGDPCHLQATVAHIRHVTIKANQNHNLPL